MRNEIFFTIDDRAFLDTIYRKESLHGVAGNIGQKLIKMFSNQKMVLERLGPSIQEDLFLFKNGVACKQNIYFNQTLDEISWDNIWNMHNNEGVTIYLRGLQKYIPEVDEILSEFNHLFESRTPFANIFITPSESTGLNAHFDPTEFLVFQISGSKIWKYWSAAPKETAEKLFPKEMAEYCSSIAENQSPKAIFELRAGDALYVPIFGIHAPKTSKEKSCHITVGLAQPDLRGMKVNNE